MLETGIIERLCRRAETTQDEEDRQLLRDAVEVIETLRILVGIREEIELEAMEPEGRA